MLFNNIQCIEPVSYLPYGQLLLKNFYLAFQYTSLGLLYNSEINAK